MLTGKQRRYLRGLGHELRAIVQVGKGGLDAGLVAALDRALLDHELVKVRLGEVPDELGDRHDVATGLASQTRSHVAQVLGNTVLLYRAHPDEPVIVLPRGL